ncbi:MAG: hypothetical protein WKF29_02045 [Thermoleophilaceae bacterium]
MIDTQVNRDDPARVDVHGFDDPRPRVLADRYDLGRTSRCPVVHDPPPEMLGSAEVVWQIVMLDIKEAENARAGNRRDLQSQRVVHQIRAFGELAGEPPGPYPRRRESRDSRAS